jgi:hypothetical protein
METTFAGFMQMKFRQDANFCQVLCDAKVKLAFGCGSSSASVMLRCVDQFEGGFSMSPDVIHALTVAGSILLAVVLLIIGVSFVTVRRGEESMANDAKHHRHSARH